MLPPEAHPRPLVEEELHERGVAGVARAVKRGVPPVAAEVDVGAARLRAGGRARAREGAVGCSDLHGAARASRQGCRAERQRGEPRKEE